MSRRLTKNKSSEKGFTLIELMISMSVFAVIMLIVVSVFIQISRLYSKGVSIARAQESARAILDEVTREIQFSSSPVVSNPGVRLDTTDMQFYCIGGKRFSYRLGTLKTDDPSIGNESLHALQKDIISANGSCPAASPGGQDEITGATELMIDNTALTDFDIDCSPDQVLCELFIRLTYGNPADDDLFMDDGGRRVCRGGIVGSEFCAIVELRSSVTRRLR